MLQMMMMIIKKKDLAEHEDNVSHVRTQPHLPFRLGVYTAI